MQQYARPKFSQPSIAKSVAQARALRCAMHFCRNERCLHARWVRPCQFACGYKHALSVIRVHMYVSTFA
eukprot:6207858-Pleurochrysis_carterae.AAC.2